MILECESLTKRFGDLIAVDSFDLSLSQGMILGLLGPNGCGKTTLLKMITGLLRPDSGKITLFGGLEAGATKLKAKIGYMPQDLAIYRGLSVVENLRFFGRLYGLGANELETRIQTILDLVDMKTQANRVVECLSGGMMRRVLLV